MELETKLARITEIARENKHTKFSTLMYLVNESTLKAVHEQMPEGKAAGILGTTKTEYNQNVDDNLKSLITQMKRMSYKPQMVRRVYIPKAGSDKKRPLGIPEYEDKLVQSIMSKVLEAIYEADFIDNSFGFRKGKSQHDAIKVLNIYLEKRKTNYVVDADIKGFFDNVSHEWMMKFLGHRISDPNFLRMIARFLKSGYLEEGRAYKTESGTPQGGNISPVLANIYLHYVLDLWFMKYRKSCKGQAYMVRYADDFVCCFEKEADAKKFYEELKERLKKFSLEMAEDKSNIIPFGPYQSNNLKTGDKKSFDFLGFTHFCSKSKSGRFRVKRKMTKKKKREKLKKMKAFIQDEMRKDVKVMMQKLNRKLVGIYNYYGITDSNESLSSFRQCIIQLLYKWLNRRSQRKSYTWEKFELFLKKYPIKTPKVKVNIYEIPRTLQYTQ